MAAKNPIPSIMLSSGHLMPVLGLGTSQIVDGGGFPAALSTGTRDAVELAIDVGYRLFDTANGYRNEKEVGAAIQKKIEQGAVTREDLFVTTKLSSHFHRPEHVLRGLQSSLANLKLDHVDLYLIHAPCSRKYIDDETIFPRDSEGHVLFDHDVDLADTWTAMEKLVDLGLARSIGVSNFSISQIQHILERCRIKPANNQVEGHAYLMQPKLFKFCQDNGITVTAYAPTGSPARWDKTKDELVLTKDPVVLGVAQRVGKSPSQVLIRYLIERGRIAIPRSTNPRHIKENFEVFDFDFPSEELAKLDGLDRKLRFFMDAMSQHSPQYHFDVVE